MVSQKCQYALRAMFELARRVGQGPVRVAEIAKAQAAPVGFLEVILNQLKQGGFVTSRRGTRGGYILGRSPASITVGEVVRFIEGPVTPVACVGSNEPRQDCPLYEGCVFVPMWEKASKAISEVYDGTTFQDLVDQARQRAGRDVPSYSI